MVTYNAAMEIIRKHQKSTPVPVIKIAHELGCRVYRAKGWPDNLSGKVKPIPEDGEGGHFAIYANAAHAKTRRRFTIAHEIAHCILHGDEIGDGISEDALYRSGLTNKQETEANRLAADILIPWHLLKKAIEKGTPPITIPALAETFRVSKSAMSVRLGVPYETTA